MPKKSTKPIDDGVRILLLAQDSDNLSKLIKPIGQIGTILTAETDHDIVSVISQQRPDVIILDMNAPIMSFSSIVQCLYELKQTLEAAFLFITHNLEHQNEIIDIDYPLYDFISSSYSEQELQFRVLALLKQIARKEKQTDIAAETVYKLSKAPYFISIWDEEWLNLHCNDTEGKWFGLTSQDLLGQPISLIMPLDALTKLYTMAVYDNRDGSFTTTFKTMVLGSRFFRIHLSRIVIDKKQHYLVSVIDESEHKVARELLLQKNTLYSETLNGITVAVIATDAHGQITYLNPQARYITGWSEEESIGAMIEKVVELRDPDSRLNVENPVRVCLRQQRPTGMSLYMNLVSKAGHSYLVQQATSPTYNDNGVITGSVSVLHQVSQSLSLAFLKHQQTMVDPLTSLANRKMIREHLLTASDIVRTRNVKIALIIIDIDNFKSFNATYGNDIADKFLTTFARRLHENYEPNHSVGRLGDDEFCIIMRDFDTNSKLLESIHTLKERLSAPIHINAKDYSVTVSVGATLLDAENFGPDKLLSQADTAVHQAKFDGGNRYTVFTKELEASLNTQRSIETLLEECLDDPERILVYYQPKVHLVSGRVVGVEALVRLLDNQGRIVQPNTFIPYAEESGIIIELGYQVLLKACKEAKSWIDKGFDIPVAVNISAVQCLQNTLVLHVKQALFQSALKAQYLELEVTETAFIKELESTLEKFQRLDEMGVSLAIDDFGKGYSNLANLGRLNIDKIKLDMSYVQGMLTNNRDYEIVKTIIALTQSTEMKIVAEGIENEMIRDELIKLGCEVGQGYLFAKPLNPNDLLHYLKLNT